MEATQSYIVLLFFFSYLLLGVKPPVIPVPLLVFCYTQVGQTDANFKLMLTTLATKQLT